MGKADNHEGLDFCRPVENPDQCGAKISGRTKTQRKRGVFVDLGRRLMLGLRR